MGLYAVRTRYGGFTGSPGFSTMHFLGSNETATQSSSVKAAAAHDLVADYMALVFGLDKCVGAGTTFSVESDVIVRDLTNGQGIAQYNVTAVSGTAAGSTELLPSANCLVTTWRSSVFGPRGRGRTFLAPGDETQNVDGTPSSVVLTDAVAHADALIAAASANVEVEFVVWHRPTATQPISGSTAVVSTASVTAQWAILRSRRD